MFHLNQIPSDFSSVYSMWKTDDLFINMINMFITFILDYSEALFLVKSEL